MSESKTILVTGASGHLGQLILTDLIKNYSGKIIAGSRNTEKLSAFKAKGVEVRKIDFDNAETLSEGFKGVDKLMLISTDALAVPGLRLKQHVNAVNAAKAAGVKEIIYTSLPNADKASIFFAPDHFGTEEAIRKSGLRFTILRNNWYDQNLLHSLGQAVKSGELVSSTEKGKVGFITREDCARVAAGVLVKGGFVNQVIDVTGENSYSDDDVAKILSEVTGKNVKHVNISEEALREHLTSAKLPPFVVDLFVTYERSVRKNELDVTNSLVKEITGAHPQNLKSFLAEEYSKGSFN